MLHHRARLGLNLINPAALPWPPPGPFSCLEIVMTEHNAPTTDSPAEASTERLIIYGIDEGGRAHASQFPAEVSALVERAAAAMAMRTVRVDAAAHAVLLKRLPQGKLFGSGKAFVPFVKAATHQQLVKLAQDLGQYQDALPPRPLLPAKKDKSEAPPHMPRSWAEITVGSLVLASEGSSKTDGWFEALVVEQKSDDLFSMRWRDWPKEDSFIRRREHVALLPLVGGEE